MILPFSQISPIAVGGKLAAIVTLLFGKGIRRDDFESLCEIMGNPAAGR
jgi:hypothetical protein